jgi:HTH-type transcriptional regulator / antitoxin HipB
MNNRNKIKLIPISEIEEELMKRPGFRKAREQSRLKYLLIGAIIEARGKHGLTQRALAKELNMAQSTLARFESGNVNPTIDFVSKLVNGLNLEVSISKKV